MKLYRSLAALTGVFALALQFWIMSVRVDDLDFLGSTIRYFSYFTIWTNILVAVSFVSVVVAPGSKAGRFFGEAAVRTGIALYIALVAVTYHLLLASQWAPQGWALVADALLHTAMPAAFLIDWLFFVDKRSVSVRSVPAWLALPIVYGLFTLGKGATNGWYPYPFLNVAEIGLAQTLINLAGFTAVYAVAGAGFVGIARLTGGFRPRISAAGNR